MTSWAAVAKKGHEKYMADNKKKLPYEYEDDRKTIVMLLSTKVNTDMLRYIYTFVGSFSYPFVRINNSDIVYKGYNILHEWGLDETEFPYEYKSYKEYFRECRKSSRKIRKYYILYDLRKFYYNITCHFNEFNIYFYKNKLDYNNNDWRYVITENAICFNYPEAINHRNRHHTAFRKIFNRLPKIDT